MAYIMILAQSVLQIFCSQGLNAVKSEKRNNSVKYSQSFMKSYPGYLHLGHNLYGKYHDLSSSCSLDILPIRVKCR